MNRILAILGGLVVAVVIASSTLFIVDQKEYAVIFALGEIKDIKSEPGLYFKLPPPFQNVRTFDKRILTIDTPDAERVQTSEKKNLQIDSFVKWRISDPKAFFQSFQGNERAAVDRILALVRDGMQQAINRRTVNDVSSRERDRIMEEVRSGVQARVKSLGVEMVDVRLKRVDFAPEISESVFNRMKAERNRVANEQRSTGAAEGEKIRATAESQRDVIIAEAYNKAQAIKGEGDAKASAIYAGAFSGHAEFYSFYRSMEAYQRAFRNRGDVMVVDPSSDFFKYMKESGANGSRRN
jgi:modulator of FtsH protease HflC